MKKVLAFLAPAPSFDLSRPLLNFGGCRGPITRHTSQWVANTYSYGGGGVIYKGTGAILPPTVRTTQIHHQEFWVSDENQYQLTGRQDVALAPGHDVGVLSANGILTQVINYTTGAIYCTAAVWEVVPQMPIPTFRKLARSVLWDTPLLTMLGACGVMILLRGLGSLLHLGESVVSMFLSITSFLTFITILGLTARSFYRRWHWPRLNAALRARGREEIAAICRERFDVDPVL